MTDRVDEARVESVAKEHGAADAGIPAVSPTTIGISGIRSIPRWVRRWVVPVAVSCGVLVTYAGGDNYYWRVGSMIAFYAMAAAALSSGGDYPAMLFVDRPNHLEQSLKNYLLDVQPGYDDTHPPTQGFYNRGWIIGATTAISAQVQARIDSLLEITRTDSANQLGDTTSNSANTAGQ